MNKKYSRLAVGGITALGLVYFLASPAKQASASATLMQNDKGVVALGKEVYAQNCALCHGKNLEGQTNWRQRDAEGYLPAPPHSKDGHTWHHPDSYLFSMTKYGIEKMINEKYPNNMPVYENKLSDDEIIAALSFIKSTWPKRIQRQHDQLNARAKPY